MQRLTIPLLVLLVSGGCSVASPPPGYGEAGGQGGDGGGVSPQGGSTQTTGGTSGEGDTPGSGNGSNAGGSGGDEPSSGGSGGSGGGNDLDALTTGTWTIATGNLANKDSTCGNMGGVFPNPAGDVLIAGVAGDGLFSSTDEGTTWVSLGTAKGSDSVINRITSVVFDPDDATHWWESGTYGQGVYRTQDDGKTLAQQGDVAHTDLVAIDFSDPQRQLLLAGGHEQSRTLNRSKDGGKTWEAIGDGLPDSTNCTLPLIIDASTYLVGCGGYGGGVTGIYRSTDAGKTWQSATGSGGFVAPLRTSDGVIYWVSANGNGLARSLDDGETWVDVIKTGGVIRAFTPIELSGGRIAAVGGQALIVSSDQGETWKAVSSAFPIDNPLGIAYSEKSGSYYIWYNTCGFNGSVPVPEDAVQRYDP